MLKNLIGGDLLEASPADLAVRIHLINMMADLLMAEEIEAGDLIELLDDWMEEHFCVIADEVSHKQIAETLVKVRDELTFCALNSLDLRSGSLTLTKLLEFN